MKFNIANEINSYINNDVGKEWYFFWNYRNSFKNPYDIFNDIYQLSYHLYCYLVQFGMARNSNSILRKLSSSEFIMQIKEYGQIIKSHKLFDIELKSPTDFTDTNIKTIDNVFKEFDEDEDPNKYLFISKILMALWGQTIAFDKYFKEAFWNIHDKDGNHFGWAEINKLVFDSHYNDMKLNDFNQKIEAKWGTKNIPIIRFIDMAYWNWGSKIFTIEYE